MTSAHAALSVASRRMNGLQLAIGLEGLKETVIGGWAPRGAGEGKGGGGLSDPRLLGRQPPKAPIWETAAFFSTAASVGAS